ncbi:hypothetical protein COB21_04580 [Candidatus Aerophobetes bacterium]|uniref:Uncharacterized protein n=1 Tax=Aerophobetes bacterium TaxID=2030807 RepID=A0A2A4X1T0_UNCAE|nr:MAG: hypothetical protein COB21_04580 [Candidatus Aerophobetes bacterium]
MASMASPTQPTHTTASQRAGDFARFIDEKLPYFASDYQRVVTEAADRAAKTNLESLARFFISIGESVVHIGKDVHALTKTEFSFSDYLWQLMQGHFIPNSQSFHINGEQRPHFWDLWVRVSAVGLFIISGATGIFAYRAIKALKQPITKLWHFGFSFGASLRLITLLSCVTLLPYASLHALLLSCDLQKLAKLLPFIDDPLANGASSWNAEVFRGASNQKDLFDIPEIRTMLENAFPGQNLERIKAEFQTMFHSDLIRNNFATNLERVEETATKEAYIEWEKTVLSCLMTVTREFKTGNFTYLEQTLNALGIHSDQYSPLIQHILSQSTAQHKARARDNFVPHLQAVATNMPETFAFSTIAMNSVRAAARATPQVVQAVAHSVESPGATILFTDSIWRTGAALFTGAAAAPTLAGVGNLGALITTKVAATYALAPMIHAGVNLALPGVWRGTDGQAFKVTMEKHLLLWNCAHTIANIIWPFAATGHFFLLIAAPIITSGVHHTAATARLGDRVARVTQAVDTRVTDTVSRVYNKYNPYYPALWVMSALIFLNFISVVISFASSISDPLGDNTPNDSDPHCGP